MAHRLYSRSQVFFDNLGQPLASGKVRFYETGTTTPKNVYSDQDLSVNLGSEETLDTAGRFSTGIWGSDDYRVRFYTADEVEVADDDPITDPAGAASAIPSQTGHSGEVLTTNGAVLSWLAIYASLLPDMSGNAGKMLNTDGENAYWKSAVELGLPEVTEGTNQWTITLPGGKALVLGNDTFPAPSVLPPHGASKAVTFDDAFATCEGVIISANKGTIATHDYKAVCVAEYTNTGFTASYNINENSTDDSANVADPIGFSWIAWGDAA